VEEVELVEELPSSLSMEGSNKERKIDNKLLNLIEEKKSILFNSPHSDGEVLKLVNQIQVLMELEETMRV
jgi:hypothetical protein